MKIERFTQLVRAYGAEAALWPAGEREAATQFLANSAEARLVVEQELRLDSIMSRSRLPAQSGALLDRIVENATAQPQGRRIPAARGWFSVNLGFGQLWHQAAGLAACALLGFFVGSSGIIDLSPNDAAEFEVSAMATDDLPFDGAGL